MNSDTHRRPQKNVQLFYLIGWKCIVCILKITGHHLPAVTHTAITSCAARSPPQYAPTPPWLLTLKSVWESHVTWGYPCAKFRLPRPFGFRVRADVRDQTDRRTTDADDCLMPPPPLLVIMPPPPYGGRGIITSYRVLLSYTENCDSQYEHSSKFLKTRDSSFEKSQNKRELRTAVTYH